MWPDSFTFFCSLVSTVASSTRAYLLANYLFLHPVGYVGHVVSSGASGVQNFDALFFMHGRDWCGSQ
jgi:hypothetical protein